MIHFGQFFPCTQNHSAYATAFATRPLRHDAFLRITFGTADTQTEAPTDPAAYGLWLSKEYRSRTAQNKIEAVQWAKTELTKWLQNQFAHPTERYALALVDLVRLADEGKQAKHPHISLKDEREILKAVGYIPNLRMHENLAKELAVRYSGIRDLNVLIRTLLDVNRAALGILRLALNDFIAEHRGEFTKEGLLAAFPLQTRVASAGGKTKRGH